MAKYIDWYLVELEKKMAPNNSQLLIHEAVGEAREHLEAITAEFQERGLSLEDSERAAVERFGGVEGMVEVRKVPEPKPNLGNWVPATTLLIFSFLLAAVAMSLPEMELILGFEAVAFVAFLVSSVACWRSGKLPALRFAFLHAVGFTGLAWLAGHAFFGPETSFAQKAEMPEVRTQIEQRLKGVDRNLSWLANGAAIYDQLGPLPTQTPEAILKLDPAKYKALLRLQANPDYYNESGYVLPNRVTNPGEGTHWFNAGFGRTRGWSYSTFEPEREPYDLARSMWEHATPSLRASLEHDKAQLLRLDEHLVSHQFRFDPETGVSVAAGGFTLSLLWFIAAFFLNGFANMWARAIQASESPKRSIA